MWQTYVHFFTVLSSELDAKLPLDNVANVVTRFVWPVKVESNVPVVGCHIFTVLS